MTSEDVEEQVFIMSQEYKDLLNYERILSDTPNKDELSVTLKRTANKGVGLYATKHIKKGETIAYYKITVFKTSVYESPTNYMYSFEVYKKDGDNYKRLIGDVDLKSFPEPLNDIPFWGPFANEPSINQKSNAHLDMNLKENYKNRKKVDVGQTMVYQLIATKHIKPGDEILWYYGPDYIRDYKVSEK